jgi:signal transduction histidine kinase
MLMISGIAWTTVIANQSRLEWALEVSLGALSFGFIRYRRRWPLTVTLVTTILGMVAATPAGPAALALVSLATRRQWRGVIPAALVAVAAAQGFAHLHPTSDAPVWWLTLSVNIVLVAAAVVWGMYLGSRRELLWSLRKWVERAEAEQEARVSQVRRHERARIAHEMHDVLAHRISQISMRAGALTFRHDLSADAMRAQAAILQQTAHEALDDLRIVLGVLRDPTIQELDEAPQPTYSNLRDLVERARTTGMRIDYDDRLALNEIPVGIGRTVYRVIEEGIDNGLKHAPGALISIRLSGTPEVGVEVVVTNPIGFTHTHGPGPEPGTGLVGLTERVELRGGHLTHGRTGSSFLLRAWIPWAS